MTDITMNDLMGLMPYAPILIIVITAVFFKFRINYIDSYSLNFC